MPHTLDDLPLFPLPIVLLPTEIVPLHIFEDRYKEMIADCLDEDSEFGIVWMSDDGLKEVGCTARVREVLERMDDGRMNILVEGASPFRVVERNEHHAFPAGTVELLGDREEPIDPTVGSEARAGFATLVERVTGNRPGDEVVESLHAYEMAASVEFGTELKQGLLELRSERARLRLLGRMFKEAMKRLDAAERIAERARGNGKVSFS